MGYDHMNDDETKQEWSETDLALNLAEQLLEKAIAQLKRNQQAFHNIINWGLVPYQRSAPVLTMMQETRNAIAAIEAQNEIDTDSD